MYVKNKSVIVGALAIGILAGCSSHEIVVEPVPPEKYEKIGEAKGEATGSHGLLSTAYYVIPMGLNSRTKRAAERAVKSVPQAEQVINVTYQEDWYWWVIGTARKVTITGDAIKEVR